VDLAGVGVGRPEHDLQQRRLSDTVATDEGDAAAVGHLERHVPEQEPRTVGLAQP
jgi:hypothetical protein